MRLIRSALLASSLFAAGCTSHKSPEPEPPHIDPDAPAKPEPFTLPDGGASVVRFIAVGDTGKGNAGQKQVADAMADFCAREGCDFVVLLGDNIYPSGITGPDDPSMQERFEKPYARLGIPFHVVLGNHDYGNDGAGTEFDKGANEVAYSKSSTKWRLPAPHHHFREGQVEFFALDTNLAFWGRAQQQLTDMQGWIRRSTAPWKISLGHHPYLSNGPHGNAGDYEGLKGIPRVDGAAVKTFLEGTVCGTTDLYLAGHDHVRTWPQGTCKGTELAVSGAGAEFTELLPTNPARWEAPGLGFLHVAIQDRTLTARFVEADGTVAFTRTITK